MLQLSSRFGPYVYVIGWRGLPERRVPRPLGARSRFICKLPPPPPPDTVLGPVCLQMVPPNTIYNPVLCLNSDNFSGRMKTDN